MSERNVGEVTEATRAEEDEEAKAAHVADRPATSAEDELAEEQKLDEGVGAHYRDMTDKGINEPGEGRIP